MDKKHLLSPAWPALTGLLLLVVTWAAVRSAATAATASSDRRAVNSGAVVINEVAWMGTEASFSDEWIELYNTTDEPIALTGWTLVADDGFPYISLDGVIPAGGYFLLERSDDSTVSDITADRIYTSSLENNPSAEILRLRDQANTIIDAVNGDGGVWPAGNNDTRQTMERIDPLVDGSDENWDTNDGLTRNGLDANGVPINGTPKSRNSAYAGPVSLQADLAVTKSGPRTALAGSIITYALRVSNTGTLTATAVHLTDHLPSAIAFITATSAGPFNQDGRLLTWTLGELPPRALPHMITVTGRISTTGAGVYRNVVTATTTTTETISANNSAVWDTRVDTGLTPVLINAVVYDGYQPDDLDEAVQLINLTDSAVDLSSWKLCDAADSGSCVTILSGTLAADNTIWLAYWASGFYTSSGTYPAYAVKGLLSETLPLGGSWPRYANTGEQVVLRDADGDVMDAMVYRGGDTNLHGWNGPAIQPWSGREGFRIEGQIIYRKLDETTGRPVPDTDTAADWAQYSNDPIYGRRVRYPGWDLETFFLPLETTESAHLVLGVAPDNAAMVVLDAIDLAQQRIDIAVYALTHPTIIQKLVEKANAGVTVTVLLEGDQAGVAKSDPRWYQQMWACQALYDSGHGACWFMINDDEARIFGRYRFMHAKYMLIDREQVLITSQNLTARGMPDDDRANGTLGSRGIALLTDAPAVVDRVVQIFDHDLDPNHHVDLQIWSPTGTDYGPPPVQFTPVLTVTDYTTYSLVFSAPLAVDGTFDFELMTAPEAALRQSDALFGLLGRANAGDGVYVEMLDERAHWGEDPVADPNPRIEAYLAAARRGARVRILLNSGQFDASYYDVGQNLATMAYANTVARGEGLDLRVAIGDPTHYGIHNKMVLVWLEKAGGYAHLGSLNGSETSNKVNREVAIQVQSDEVFAYLKRVFDWDWHVSNPMYLPAVMVGWSRPAPPAKYPLISEVLYNPSGAEEGDEWVEIYNPTDQAVDLSGWLLGDVDPAGEFGSGLYRFPAETTLPADGVLVVARQAADVIGFVPELEFLIDPLRDDARVPNMVPAGNWEGFGFALGNAGDEVILLKPAPHNSATETVDVLVYGAGGFPGVAPHPGVSAPDHSLERRPAIYDTDDCGQDFRDRYPPDPGTVSNTDLTPIIK